jgi:voltage-gated sodium channel
VNSIFVDAIASDNNDELEKKIDNLEFKINQLLKRDRN